MHVVEHLRRSMQLATTALTHGHRENNNVVLPRLREFTNIAVPRSVFGVWIWNFTRGLEHTHQNTTRKSHNNKNEWFICPIYDHGFRLAACTWATFFCYFQKALV